MKLSRAIYNTLAVGAVIVGVANAADHSFSTEITNAMSSGVGMSATIAPSSTIEISANNVALDIVPSINGTFRSDYTTVSTYTNTSNTCTVTMTTSSTNLTSGNNTIATLASDVAESEFTNDRWGFRVGTTGNYRAVAAENTIATYTQNTGSNNLDSDVYFAAKLTATTKAGNYTDTVTFTSTCAPNPMSIQDLDYMQDFATLTSSERAEVLTSMTTNQQYRLKDNRDEKPYYISKLADGNVWMTQNLDHDIVTTQDFYTYDNTDIGHSSIPNTQTTWTADRATYATNNTNWYDVDDPYSNPESYDPGDLCWNGTLGNYTIATGATACGNDEHYHIGNYYNWTAAVAMNDSSSYITDQQDVDQSICPAGWRLPIYSGDKSYGNLITGLSLIGGASGNVQNIPVYFVYGAYWCGDPGGIGHIGSSGDYWLSVVNYSNEAYKLTFTRYGGSISSQGSQLRGYGFSVRCVAR